MAGTSRREREAAGRRAVQLLKFVGFQALLALALVVVAVLLREDRRAFALCLVTLVVPVGWSLVYVLAHRRVEAARRAGTWTPDWERAQGKTTAGAFGAIMLVWVLVAVLIVLYA
ncbi:MAG: hypothetical protein QOE90_2075 [Thermoplasmata archaeon]|jgi:hypothetical protein|nr:hypothetical protein [Thermoplasmata archaeon]